MEKKISIVIPFNNEYENLIILIPELIHHIKAIDYFFEIILVNDFSNDGSLKYYHSLKKKNSNYELKIINLLKRSGQTEAFKKAFEIATGGYIIRMDADLQDQPEHIKLFVKKINEGCDLIIGHRLKRHHNLFLIFASAIYDGIIKIIFKSPLKTNSGSFVAFRAMYVKNLPWYNNDHRYLPVIAMLKGAKKLCSITIPHKRRLYGKTHYNTLSKLIKGMPEIILLIIRIFLKKYD